MLDPVHGRVVLQLIEKVSLRSWVRPFVGHFWGFLRAEYALVRDGREVGALRRPRAVGNKLVLEMSAEQGLDHRVVLAAVLFIERVDPDRWHPWFA